MMIALLVWAYHRVLSMNRLVDGKKECSIYSLRMGFLLNAFLNLYPHVQVWLGQF